MVSAAASFFADVIVPLVSFVIEACMHILVASARPWRFVLSASYRAEVNSQYSQRYVLLKWWYLIWGAIALVASIAVLAGGSWFLLALFQPEPPHSLKQQAVERAERALVEKLKSHQEGRQ